MKCMIIFIIALIAFVNANCGCLKCSKHLTVVSPPYASCKLIYRGKPSATCLKPLPITVQAPIIAPKPIYIPKDYDYKVCFMFK